MYQICINICIKKCSLLESWRNQTVWIGQAFLWAVDCEHPAQWDWDQVQVQLCADFKKKKDVHCESCKLSFICGQNEDCSLGDSASDGSEILLQRGGSGGMSGYVLLVNGGGGRVQAIRHLFIQKVSTTLMKLC